jgi:hypothetical protein
MPRPDWTKGRSLGAASGPDAAGYAWGSGYAVGSDHAAGSGHESKRPEEASGSDSLAPGKPVALVSFPSAPPG